MTSKPWDRESVRELLQPPQAGQPNSPFVKTVTADYAAHYDAACERIAAALNAREAALRDEVEALRVDNARLDWLDKVSAGTIRMDRYDFPPAPGLLGMCPAYVNWGPHDIHAHRTARAAIDAAMTTAQGGG